MLTVSYTTRFMPPQAQGLTWAASIILPLILSGPICFYFANTLRRLAIAHQELEVVASQDSLTTCPNRGAFLTLVDAYLNDVRGEPPKGAVLVVDADHFKAINDRWGHAAADDALRLIVGAMRSVVRPMDLIGRIGGEEFAIFLPKLDWPAAEEIAERVRRLWPWYPSSRMGGPDRSPSASAPSCSKGGYRLILCWRRQMLSSMLLRRLVGIASNLQGKR